MQNSILIDTLKGRHTPRPPVWFMRQAGRVLPSYLELRNHYSFWQLMKDPTLAARVTLLPVYDLGVDAAILFSDILVVPYAMGMGLEFTDQGPRFDKPLIELENPLAALKPEVSRLDYIYQAIRKIVETRPVHIPLIGFAGAPLTVLCYMLEGLSSRANFTKAVSYIYRNRKTVEKLIEGVTEMTIEYISRQIENGIDVFQLFETHAGVLPFEIYHSLFMPSIRKISQTVRDKGIRFIFFPKDIGAGLKSITPDICDFVSIDWQTPLSDARKLVHPAVGLQGNFDPRLLFADQSTILNELQKLLDFGNQEYSWIFNLGHGFLQGTPFENARYVVEWVKTVNWRRIT